MRQRVIRVRALNATRSKHPPRRTHGQEINNQPFDQKKKKGHKLNATSIRSMDSIRIGRSSIHCGFYHSLVDDESSHPIPEARAVVDGATTSPYMCSQSGEPHAARPGRVEHPGKLGMTPRAGQVGLATRRKQVYLCVELESEIL